MPTLEKMALTLDEEIYQEFKVALARGCWSSGLPMTEKQKRICNEVVCIREAPEFFSHENRMFGVNEKTAHVLH